MKKRIVIVGEKPSVMRRIGPHLVGQWPDAELIVICLGIGRYEFKYPRGLALTDFPAILEPAWKPVESDFYWVYTLSPSGDLLKTDLPYTDALIGADTIVCATDPDHSGAVNFHVLLEQVLGADAANAAHPAITFVAFDPAAIEDACNHPLTTHHPTWQRWTQYGLAKRFFDYNFNVNAMAIFGQVFRRIGLKEGTVVSKYGLQLMYGLFGKPPMSPGAIAEMMYYWPGTGRYKEGADSPGFGLGSAMSRGAILGQLTDAGLLTLHKHPELRPKESIEVSPLGLRFLHFLHPDCMDKDLPFRLGEWCGNWPASRPAMERYLRTFFGKQQRFFKNRVDEERGE